MGGEPCFSMVASAGPTVGDGCSRRSARRGISNEGCTGVETELVPWGQAGLSLG